MGKRVTVFLGMLMGTMLLLSSAALAVGTTTYELDALDMSIELPDDYIVFTRDMAASDPNYAQFGFSKEQVDAMLEESNTYFDALLPDASREIAVTMIDMPMEDFNQFSDTTLSALDSEWQTAAESYGATYIKSELYQHEQAKFVKIYTSSPFNDQTMYTLQYYTVCNRQAISIALRSYAGKITSENEDELQRIVDSADFRGAKSLDKAGLETGPFTYTDTEAGLSFTVPAHWSQEELSEERETLDAKFVSTQELGLCILYGSVDAWEEIPEYERVGRSRAEFDNSAFTAMDFSDAAKEWGVEDAKVSTVDYGDKMYYAVEGTCGSQAYGLDISAPVFILMRAENGYLFQFWFMGEFDNPYYDDFVSLVSSARYPSAMADDLDRYDEPMTTNKPIATNKPVTANKPAPSGSAGIIVALICVAVLVAGGVVAFLLIRREKAKKQSVCAEYTDAGESETGWTPAQGAETRIVIRFCHKCGSELAPNSRFCNQCGVEIPAAAER